MVRYLTRILIVEEDAELLEMLRCYLERKDIARIRAVEDYLLGLQSHLERPCDVAVVSTTAPGMHYSRFVDRLTGIGRPQIILTAPTIDPDDLLRSLRLGVSDVLVKPFELDDLGQRIEPLVARSVRAIRARRRRRRERQELRNLSIANRALQERVNLLSRDVVGAYQRLAQQVAQARP